VVALSSLKIPVPFQQFPVLFIAICTGLLRAPSPQGQAEVSLDLLQTARLKASAAAERPGEVFPLIEADEPARNISENRDDETGCGHSVSPAARRRPER
jgi:hypothetical protein